MAALLFILFGGVAIGCAIGVVTQRNPLNSAISLIGVFVALASLYVMLAAPFIAAVQVIVYAGAIMVLVIFVIMLLNIEEEEPRRPKLRWLVPVAIGLATVLIAEAAFVLYSVQNNARPMSTNTVSVGQTHSIGVGLFTTYLLPFEVTSILLLMAIVGAMALARDTRTLSPTARIVPGAAVLPLNLIDPDTRRDLAQGVETDTTEEAARLLGVAPFRDPEKRD